MPSNTRIISALSFAKVGFDIFLVIAISLIGYFQYDLNVILAGNSCAIVFCLKKTLLLTRTLFLRKQARAASSVNSTSSQMSPQWGENIESFTCASIWKEERGLIVVYGVVGL